MCKDSWPPTSPACKPASPRRKTSSTLPPARESETRTCSTSPQTCAMPSILSTQTAPTPEERRLICWQNWEPLSSRESRSSTHTVGTQLMCSLAMPNKELRNRRTPNSFNSEPTLEPESNNEISIKINYYYDHSFLM